jgi:FtsZ-interacting cell division protein ZipA
MSELQISLLAIGAIVVLAVYAYGAWQQRRYRAKFGAAFASRQGDALYQGHLEGQAAGEQDEDGDKLPEYPLPDIHDTRGEPDESCGTLNEAADYIAVMFAAMPLRAEVLASLLERRFDFGKNLHVCGVRAEGGQWERVVAESQHLYDTFRLALQLVDRGGAVTEGALAGFRDMVRDLAEAVGAEVNLPDAMVAAQSASRLDAFCAEVDQMIGLNILPSGGNLLMGGEVARVAQRLGMVLQADGVFHLLDAGGHTVFTLGNFDETPFRRGELDETPVIGLSLQLDVPRVEYPARRFEEMVVLARRLGEELSADVVDDHRSTLGNPAIAAIRGQVAAIEKRMLAYPIIPGSPLARRLFS